MMDKIFFESKRKRYMILRNQLDMQRSTFISNWRDIADYVLPMRTRFFLYDTNRGERRNFKIINSAATMASNTLASGMMSGVTSPARPWFRLGAPDPAINDLGPVKEWLYKASDRMTNVFLKSNLYNVLPQCYKDLGVFGTAPISVQEDFNKVVHFTSHPLGSYWIAKDDQGYVRVFYSEFSMTVRQLIQRFGRREDNGGKVDWSVFTKKIKDFYERGMLETWIDVVHAVAPNDDYDPRSPFSKHKKFESIYFERGTMSGAGTGAPTGYMQGPELDQHLELKGFDFFPFLVPRWSVTGEDVYATDCPGMTAIGDIKQLQYHEKKSAKAIDKMVDPPMVGPSSLQNSSASTIAGGITFINGREIEQFKAAQDVKLDIGAVEGKISTIEHRISRAFFEDLFLMLSQSDRREITAREIDERHEEKLLALGPVLEQLNQDLLDPLIDITFAIMVKQRLLPPAPPQLQGQALRVEYISVMAQAQKMIGIQSQERFMQSMLQLIPVVPEVKDKVNFDRGVEIYGDNLSVAPGIVRTDEEVAKIRAQRARAQQQANQSEQMQNQAMAAKNLSQADTSGDNALTRLMDQAKAGQVVPQT